MGGKGDCDGRPEAAKSDIFYLFVQGNFNYFILVRTKIMREYKL